MSNMTDFQAAADFDKVMREQGWTLATTASILSDFITLQGLWPQARDYAKERAAEENQQSEGSEG